MINFDATAKTIRLNVNDLVHSTTLFDEEFQAAGPGRGHLGSIVHSEYFRSQDPAKYRHEIFIRWEGEWRGFKITVEGRADGVRAGDDGRLVIEEIKSTLRHGRLMSDMIMATAHAEQCALYCLLLFRNGEPVTSGVVRYISISDRSMRTFDIGFDPEVAGELFERRLTAIIRDQQLELAQLHIRRDFADTMAFPFTDIRPGQQLMIDEIEKAMCDGRIILCSAPTGIGKTAAALFPALRQSLLNNRKLFFVTAKISQQELALQTLRRIIKPGSGVCAMQLTARERVCPMEELHCMVGHCPMTEAFDLRLIQSGILDRYQEAGVVDGKFLRTTAVANKLCPFEVSLALALRSSVIIADYNYVFDPNVALKRFFDDPATDQRYSLVADEAHNLATRAAGYYSPEIDIAALEEMIADALNSDIDVYRDAGILMQEVTSHYRRMIGALAGENGEAPHYIAEPDRHFFNQVRITLDPLFYDYFVYLAGGGRRPVAFTPTRQRGSKRVVDPFMDALFALRDFCRCCEYDSELFTVIWYRDARVKMLCLDPAPLLRERINLFTSAVFMSATLTPFDFYRKILGVDAPTTAELELPSPFPRSNRRFIVVKTVDTTFKGRGRDVAAIASLINRSIALKPGNYLAFFPSFAFRDAVMEHFDQSACTLITQTPAMRTDDVLARLTGNTNGTILLSGVMGGVFSEGVDYPGHMAIGAFIVGPGLPQVGPEHELIKNYFQGQTGHGFEFAYVNPGINRVVQAGGRVIRSETDRGFVMLICRRFSSKMYYAKFPAYWRDELVTPEDALDELRRFWAGESVP